MSRLMGFHLTVDDFVEFMYRISGLLKAGDVEGAKGVVQEINNVVKAHHLTYSTKTHRETYNRKRKAEILKLDGYEEEPVPYKKFQCSLEDIDSIQVAPCYRHDE